MGFCKCGPNDLVVGQECKECGYVIPDKKYEKVHFLGILVIAAVVGTIAFFFLALPFVEWVEKKHGHGNFWLTFASLWCVALAIKAVDIMGPYHDGIAKWEDPSLWPDGFEGDEL